MENIVSSILQYSYSNEIENVPGYEKGFIQNLLI